MTLSAEKLAPRVIALAVVGYCVWPSIAQFVARAGSQAAAESVRAGRLAAPAGDPAAAHAGSVRAAPARRRRAVGHRGRPASRGDRPAAGQAAGRTRPGRPIRSAADPRSHLHRGRPPAGDDQRPPVRPAGNALGSRPRRRRLQGPRRVPLQGAAGVPRKDGGTELFRRRLRGRFSPE